MANFIPHWASLYESAIARLKLIEGNNNEFEIFKIVLDKLLLAAVVGIASVITAVLLERYKSVLKRQEELSKITLPKIQDLMVEAESIFDVGINTIQTLTEMFASFDKWVDTIYSAPVKISSCTRVSSSNAEKIILVGPSSSLNLREFLISSAPNHLIRQIINDKDFFRNELQYDLFDGFISMAVTVLSVHPEIRDNNGKQAMRLTVSKSIFSVFVIEPRRHYRQKLSKFALMLMRNIPDDLNRSGRKSIKMINSALNEMGETIDKYPINDLIKFTNIKDIPATQRLLSYHGVLISQLRMLMYKSL